MSRPRLTPLEQAGAIAALIRHPEDAAHLLYGPGLGMFDDGPPRQAVALIAWWGDTIARDGWHSIFEARDAVWHLTLEESRGRRAPARVRHALAFHVSRVQVAGLVAWCVEAPAGVVREGAAIVDELLERAEPRALTPQDAGNAAATDAFLAEVPRVA